MKKFISRLLPVTIIIVSFLILSEFIGGWTYIKINGRTYVLCSYQTETEGNIKEEIGTVNFRFPYGIKPIFNNTATGVPFGTKIYRTKNNEIAVKHKETYYVFASIEGENWGNGVKISLSKEK